MNNKLTSSMQKKTYVSAGLSNECSLSVPNARGFSRLRRDPWPVEGRVDWKTIILPPIDDYIEQKYEQNAYHLKYSRL